MRFTIDVTVCVDLELEEIWPDGDHPDNPTAVEVAALIKQCGRASTLLVEWGLDDDAEVEVTDKTGTVEVVFS